LIADQEHAENPTIEVAHEAVFTGWRRLSRWIESNAGKLRVCRSLTLAARDWQQAGTPPFKHLPDRATLKQYRRVRPECSLGKDAGVVQRYLGAAKRRQRLWGGFLALVVLVISILGVDIWLRSQEMNWNVLRIWAMAQVGVYGGPAMVAIESGSFHMGAPDCGTGGDLRECPQHPVTIQSFEIGQFEVTFDEYAAFVMDVDNVELPDDENWGRGARPAINVSWHDAKAYAEWLSKVTGQKFRLPTEAEWEYAVRAGMKTAFYFGNDPDKLREYAWYYNNSEGKTHPVGQKKPNDRGLYDMHGNVLEWVEDDYHGNYNGAPVDGQAWFDDPRGALRVIRGGSWDNGARRCRSAARSSLGPVDYYGLVGFRLSRSVTLGP
jgi:formylglycine-generating enzyme required for sulfatase activity